MRTRRLPFSTGAPTEFLDVTAWLRAEVERSGLEEGSVIVQSLHTTLGLAVNEHEPLLLRDLQAMLERLAPAGGEYRHDQLELRRDVPLDEPSNGHAHCRNLLLPATLTLIVENGQLVLGRWQSVFAVELDGPRDRSLALQLAGRFAKRGGRQARRPEAAATGDPDQRLIEIELERQLLLDDEPVGVPMRRLVEAGGKRLRPGLVVLCSRLGPRHDPLRAATLGAAVELIHDATLVHDDYVDQAGTRRGRPAVAAAEGPARAIAVGDYYFAKATRLIAELGDEAVTRVIADAMETICLAQIDDVRMRGQYPGDPQSYREVVRGKTAALIAAACEAGARLGGAAPDVSAHLARYGELLGIAFQMEDDLLDYSDRSGKPRGTDIRSRTVSLPLIYATEDALTGDEIRRLLAGSLDDDAIDRVQALVHRSGALQRVEMEAHGLIDAAVHELDEVDANGVAPKLARLARGAVGRVR